MRAFFATQSPGSLLTRPQPTILVFTGTDADRRRRAVQKAAADAGAAHRWHCLLIDGEGEATREQKMRSALRQDPDLIAVDLLTNASQASLFLTAAETGHWVIAAMDVATPEEARRALSEWADAGGPPGMVDQLSILFVDVRAEVTLEMDRPAAPVRREPTVEELYRLGDRERPVRTRTLLETLAAALDPHRRSAWLPVLAEPEGDGSKFGGRPRLMAGETRPLGEDGQPRFLVLQLEVGSLPAGAREHFGGTGWLQFFRSLDEGADQEKANLVRMLDSLSTVLAEPVTIDGDVWTARAITGWKPIDDFPHHEDWPELGITLTDDDRIGMDLVERLREKDLAAILEGTERGRAIVAVLEPNWSHYGLTVQSLIALRRYTGPHRGDKLLGWPCWEQGPEWPEDGGQRMEHLFQVEFDESDPAALPSLIASDGRGHLFRSTRDPARFAFPWACG